MTKTYTRKLTTKESKSLGDDWQRKLDRSFDDTVKASKTSSNGETVSARVLGLMSDTKMDVHELHAEYCRKFDEISLSHVRYNLNLLLKSRQLIRVRHGIYVLRTDS